MQTLDLSGTAPRPENRLKSLFWPTVRTATDVDSLGAQGYWICAIVAAVTGIDAVFTGQPIVGVLIVLLYYVGGVGVRQHSCAAAIIVFAFFLLGTVAGPIAGLFGIMFYVAKLIVCVILLSNVRATFVASFWERGAAEAEMPARFNETWGDKFVDRFPAWLWPKVRIAYYIYGAIFMGLATLGLAMIYIQRYGLIPPRLLHR